MLQHRPGQVITRPITRILKQPSDREQRLSELTGFSAGTPVQTTDGVLTVDHLAEGDRVITRRGARVLRQITSSVVEGAFVIRPHTLGHDRPDTEICLGPRRQIVLRDWRAQALYQRDQAVVPVARLFDGEYIAPAGRAVRLFQLQFAHDEVIYAGGLEAFVHGATP